MKNLSLTLLLVVITLFSRAQVQIDKAVELTGSGSNAKVTGIQEVINNPDAANKIYVDTAIANRAGGNNCPGIELPDAGNNISAVNSSTVTLSAKAPVLATGMWSIQSGTGGNITNPSSASATFTGNDNTAYVLKWTLSVPGCPTMSDFISVSFSVANYPNGNLAYWTERTNGFRPVTVAGDPTLFTYDATNEMYRNIAQGKVLLPTISRQGVSQPETVSATNFYGFSNGTASNTNFQWDGQTTLTGSMFDVNHMFVSPLSASGMSYCTALQANASSCSSSQNNGPENPVLYATGAVFAYNTAPNGTGPYYMNNGEDLVPGTSIPNFGTKTVSQQALTTDGVTTSYCVQTYGNGWRLPTDIEVGRPNSLKDNGNPALNLGYKGTTNVQTWTTARGCQDDGTTCYPFYRQTYRLDNSTHTWPWSNGQLQLSTANYVRCVYDNAQ